MPDMMRCCVRQPEECQNYVVYTGAVHNWIQVALPERGVLCFCPLHHEAGQKALRLAKYFADLERAREAYWKERHGR